MATSTKYDHEIKLGDTFSNFDFQIVRSDGTPVNVLGASPIELFIKKPSAGAFAAASGTVAILDAIGNCSYAYDAADVDEAGTMEADCRFTLGGKIGTSPGNRFFQIRIYDH